MSIETVEKHDESTQLVLRCAMILASQSHWGLTRLFPKQASHPLAPIAFQAPFWAFPLAFQLYANFLLLFSP